MSKRPRKMFKIREFRWKMRYFTHFKHQIMQIKHRFGILVVSLQQKKILMVKVYG